MTILTKVPQNQHPDACLFGVIARCREAWLNCEKAWNACDLATDFGADDTSNYAALSVVTENLETVKNCLALMLGSKPETVRGVWAYLELIRDLSNHLRLNPESSISDIDYAAHLANIARCLECHVYEQHADVPIA